VSPLTTEARAARGVELAAEDGLGDGRESGPVADAYRNAPRQYTPAPAAGGDAPVTVLGLLATLVESWKLLLGAALGGAAIAAAVTLPKPRTFTARMALVTVTTSRAPSLGGVLGAGLLNLSGSGIQATPAFVLRLMETESILRAVALTPLPDSGRLLVTALAGGGRPPRSEQYAPLVARTVETRVDRDAGTITLTATHSDSAVARLIAGRMLEETGRGFLHASRAQATQQRPLRSAAWQWPSGTSEPPSRRCSSSVGRTA